MNQRIQTLDGQKYPKSCRQLVLEAGGVELTWAELRESPVKNIKRRHQIWLTQDGKCYYCERDTILPTDLLMEFLEEVEAAERGDLIDHMLKTSVEFKRRWHDDLATLEHLVPRGSGGKDALDNLVVACSRCNQKRGTETHQEHMDELAMKDKTSRRMPRRGYKWDHVLEQWILPDGGVKIQTSRPSKKVRKRVLP